MAYYMAGDDGDPDGDDNDHLKGFNSAAWRYWCRYCETKTDTPWRDDHAANAGIDPVGYERELLLWTNALPEILGMMSSRKGWTSPPRPSSALKNLRTVRSLMVKSGINPPPLAAVAHRCHRMMLKYLKDNGVSHLLPHQKEPFTNKMIMDFLTCDGPTRGVGRRARPWDWSGFEGVMWKGYIHTAAQTGMRNEEFTAGPRGFTKRDLSLANLAWYIKATGTIHKCLTPDELRSLGDGDYALLTPAPSKCDPFGMRWGAKPIWLPFSHTDWLCAARALRDVELLRPLTTPAERSNAPLFAHEAGMVWTRSYTFDLLRLFVRHIGVADDHVNDYTPHSFRIYLCNALASAGLGDRQIQAALRWASADAINTYHLTDAKTYSAWLAAAMTADFNVVRGATLRREDGRKLPRVDNYDAAYNFVSMRHEILELAHEDALEGMEPDT